jgi:hypothetical protein
VETARSDPPQPRLVGSAFFPPLLYGHRRGLVVNGPLASLRFDRDALVLSVRKGLNWLVKFDDVRVPLSRIREAKTRLGGGVRFLSDDRELNGLAFRPAGVSTKDFIAMLERSGVRVSLSPFSDKVRDFGREWLSATALRKTGSW